MDAERLLPGFGPHLIDQIRFAQQRPAEGDELESRRHRLIDDDTVGHPAEQDQRQAHRGSDLRRLLE